MVTGTLIKAKEYYTPQEVAEMFHYHVRYIQRPIRDGKLRAFKLPGGRRYAIPRDAIESFGASPTCRASSRFDRPLVR